jgi:tRNA-specific 2-thiouridylase
MPDSKMTDASGKKVFVAVSGGVDSSTAAAVLLQDGFQCQGVFMLTCDQSQPAREKAQAVADKLSIKLHVLDLRKDFENVLEYFCNEYAAGRTPNPCVFCNREIKFGKLWQFAQENGADFFATGHYARIVSRDGTAGLYTAADMAKDQSYVLAMIEKDVLPHIILPMGGHSKDHTRALAAEFGLGTEKLAESQEICFIPDDDYAAVLQQRRPELVRQGNIVDSTGKILGQHNGVHHYTIGQRRGLGVAMGKPYYVTKIDARSNMVTLGPKDQVMKRTLSATGVNWLIEPLQSSFRATARIRYNSSGADATVHPDGDRVTVEFDQPVSAITPGQLCVIYLQGDQHGRVAAGAWIENVLD